MDDDLKNTDDDLKKPPARSVKEMKSVRSKPELPSLENIFSGSLKTKPFSTPFIKSKVDSSEGERRKKCKTGDSSHSFMSASDDDEDKDGKKGHCKDGKKKDDSLPGKVSAHKLSGLDNSEHLLRRRFELSSWSLLLENRSVQEYIDILGPK